MARGGVLWTEINGAFEVIRNCAWADWGDAVRLRPMLAGVLARQQ